MDNISFFYIEKLIDGEMVNIKKYINTSTGELVDFDEGDGCNFVLSPDKQFNISCATFCDKSALVSVVAIIAVDDNVGEREVSIPYTVKVSINDTSLNCLPITYTIISTNNCTVVNNGDGTFEVTPTAGGKFDFEYKACCENDQTCDTAKVFGESICPSVINATSLNETNLSELLDVLIGVPITVDIDPFIDRNVCCTGLTYELSSSSNTNVTNTSINGSLITFTVIAKGDFSMNYGAICGDGTKDFSTISGTAIDCLPTPVQYCLTNNSIGDPIGTTTQYYLSTNIDQSFYIASPAANYATNGVIDQTIIDAMQLDLLNGLISKGYTDVRAYISYDSTTDELVGSAQFMGDSCDTPTVLISYANFTTNNAFQTSWDVAIGKCCWTSTIISEEQSEDCIVSILSITIDDVEIIPPQVSFCDPAFPIWFNGELQTYANGGVFTFQENINSLQGHDHIIQLVNSQSTITAYKVFVEGVTYDITPIVTIGECT